MWTPVVQALDLTENDYIAPTMPGFDGQKPAGFAATKEAYLEWVMRTLEITAYAHGPVDLVGHDWGAPLSATAAQMRPGAIRTWTVVNAAPEPSYKWHALARTWQTPQPSPHFAGATTIGKNPVPETASANFFSSGVRRCSGMFGINS
jgi:pimeloyl-ACP methyl ester carboxylesterase